MSKEAMEAALADERAPSATRGLLLAMAYRSFDSHPPFKVNLTLAGIAELGHVEYSQAKRTLKRLEKAGCVKAVKVGRNNTYAVDCPLPDTTGVRSAPDFEDRGTIRPPSDADDTTGVRSAPDTGVRSAPHTGVRSAPDMGYDPPPIDDGSLFKQYKHIETERNRERPAPQQLISTGRADAEQTPTPHPPSPMTVMSAAEVWKLILAYLEGEVSKHELDSWHSRSRPAWREDGVYVIRGGASLMGYDRFQKCVRYALDELGADVDVVFEARETRQQA